MSALTELSAHLKEFRELPYHNDPQLAEKLYQVQEWQKDRLRQTHSDLFSQPKNKPMADYFLNHLYGGDTLTELVGQLERIVPKAQKVEKYAPKTALQTGTSGIITAINSTKLDVHVAQWLVENNLEVNTENMHAAYVAVDDADARRQQIKDLEQVCYNADKYLNSFVLQQAFKLAKKKAYQHRLNSLYDFIGAGLKAMKPLKSVKQFIDPFCKRELEIIDEVHSNA